MEIILAMAASKLDHVRSYYQALNTGDVDLVASHFTDDAVHYYTRLGPHEGARAIGENSHWGVDQDGQWYIESALEGDDEVAIEWTMTWRDPKSGEERLNRGAEFLRFRDGRSARSAPTTTATRRTRSGDLLGFDHEGRGYTTMKDWKAP